MPDADPSPSSTGIHPMNTFRFRHSDLILSTIAALFLATSTPCEVSAGTTFDLGNNDIQGITGPGANQLTTPYASLDILGNTLTGQVIFTLSTSAHNAGSPINSVFNDISFNTPLTLGSGFTLLSASNG